MTEPGANSSFVLGIAALYEQVRQRRIQSQSRFRRSYCSKSNRFFSILFNYWGISARIAVMKNFSPAKKYFHKLLAITLLPLLSGAAGAQISTAPATPLTVGANGFLLKDKPFRIV